MTDIFKMESTWVEADSQYRKYKELKKSDVQLLMEWVQQQPHLPQITELELILFLHSCYFSNEAAKKCIDDFCTTRTHTPEFFKNISPFGDEITATVDKIHVVPLPKFTPEGYGMLYIRLATFTTDDFCFTSMVKLTIMVMVMWIKEAGCLNGNIMILDMAGCTLGHLTKINLVSLKKLLYFVQEALPIRMKGIYFVNPGPVVDRLMALIMPLISKDLQKIFKVLPPKDLFNHLSPDILPVEAGGNLGPLITLKGNQLEKLRNYADYFEMDEKRTTDESKRPGKPRDSGDLFGVEGTFKKLDID